MSNLKSVTEADFDADVISNKLPVLVDFWAEWCGPCKALAPTLERVSAEYEGKINIVKVNVDENTSMRDRFAVRGIPAMILFNGGREVGRAVGTKSATQLARFLDEHLGTTSEITASAPTNYSAYAGNAAFKEKVVSTLRDHITKKSQAPDQPMFDAPLVSSLRVATGDSEIEGCAAKLGIPEEVAATAEALATNQRRWLKVGAYVQRWLESVPVGANLRSLPNEFVVRALKTETLDRYIDGDAALDSLRSRLVALHTEELQNNPPTEEAWKTLRAACDEMTDPVNEWRHRAVGRVLAAAACRLNSDSLAVASFAQSLASLRTNELKNEVKWSNDDENALVRRIREVHEEAQKEGKVPPRGDELMDVVAKNDPQIINRFRSFNDAGQEALAECGEMLCEIFIEATSLSR